LLASCEGGPEVIAAQLFAVIKAARDDFRTWRQAGGCAELALIVRAYGTLPKHQTKHRRSGDRSAVIPARQLLILQCHLRPEQRPLDGRDAAVRLVEHSQSMGGRPRRSHVHQPGRIRICIGGSPMVT
jgi:hypothetical protein